eukprot:2299932-Pleurochrysis_carterae.AAC.1
MQALAHLQESRKRLCEHTRLREAEYAHIASQREQAERAMETALNAAENSRSLIMQEVEKRTAALQREVEGGRTLCRALGDQMRQLISAGEAGHSTLDTSVHGHDVPADGTTDRERGVRKALFPESTSEIGTRDRSARRGCAGGAGGAADSVRSDEFGTWSALHASLSGGVIELARQRERAADALATATVEVEAVEEWREKVL